MNTKVKAFGSNNLLYSKLRIRLPAEHGAVITFLLGLILSIGLSEDKLLTAVGSIFFFSIFCCDRNVALRAVLAVVACVLFLILKLPLAILTIVILCFGRMIMKLAPNIPIDFKQGAALVVMSLLPMTAMIIGETSVIQSLSKSLLFVHAAVFSTASVFWLLNRKLSFFLFFSIALVLLLVAGILSHSTIPAVLLLDLAAASVFISFLSGLTLKKAGIINGVYLLLLTASLIL